MSARTPQDTAATHPVQPREKKVDVEAAHWAIAARFPKTLAELAK